jgi:methionyl-tRNA formyltransferase
MARKRPRIVFFGTGPSSALADLCSSGREIVGIVHSVRRRRRSDDPLGPSAILRRLARSAKRPFVKPGATLEQLAAEKGVPFHRMDRGSDAALESFVRSLAPDLIVVCGMVELMKRNIFSIPPLGAINLHPSLLPRHRGPDPFFWTYHDMDVEGGTTIHRIDEGADTGEILAQERVPIPLGLPRNTLIRETMGDRGCRLLSRAIDDLAAGTARPVPQPAESPTGPARRVQPWEHALLVEWERWPIERVWHFLRGTEPWLHALPHPPGWRRAMGWTLGPFERGRFPGRPGSIARDGKGFRLAHPEGCIRLAVRYSGVGAARTVLPGLRRPVPRPAVDA